MGGGEEGMGGGDWVEVTGRKGWEEGNCVF